jgi:hypothetical protein
MQPTHAYVKDLVVPVLEALIAHPQFITPKILEGLAEELASELASVKVVEPQPRLRRDLPRPVPHGKPRHVAPKLEGYAAHLPPHIREASHDRP